jgi:acyl-CoA synthetase (NDP forming)/GNAT superfamily N-acetyltransferase
VLADDPPPSEALLADGTIVTIRPLVAGDHPAVRELHERASERSRWFRFFSAGSAPVAAYVDHLFGEAAPTAFVVERGDVMIGIGTAEPVSDEVEEVAFLVDDRWQGRGAASLLLEQLADDARHRGISRLSAEVMADNHQMLAVFLDAGFEVTRTSRHGVTTVSLDPDAGVGLTEATTAREVVSERRSLAPLMTPGSVVIMGVRRDGTGVGAAVLAAVRHSGYRGTLAVVHPSGEPVAGLPTSRHVGDLPDVPDLAVVTAPGPAALAAVTDAAQAGVGAAVVLSSGFDELDRRGATLQRDMLRVARDHSMRLVGPNCLGVVLNAPGVRLNATFQRFLPPPGGLALAAQSGGVGIVLLDLAERRDLGVRCFLSLGNKADVSGNDLLAAWRDDPSVTVAGLYLESFGNARKFARLARSFSERKPVLAVVGGSSSGGARAGASHTAAALTDTVGVQALFTQTGVIECHSAEELVETAAVLAEQPRPAGRRLAILSNAGGMGVLAADAADRAGLLVPSLSSESRRALAHHVHGTVGTTNPVDVGAAAAPEQVAAAAAVLLEPTEADALLVVLVDTEVSSTAESLRALAEVRGRSPDQPVVVVSLGRTSVPREASPGETAPLTELPSIEAAVRALAHAADHAEWCRTPHGVTTRRVPERLRATHERIERLLASRGEGFLDPADTADLLGPYGALPVGEVARGAAEAVAAATAIGFPVAVKSAAAEVVHRTERGLVRVGLTDADQVGDALRAFSHELRLPDGETAVWVQPVRRGVELALGLARDPTFGPLVMVAAGGIATDALADRSFLLPPFDERDVRRALRSLRVAPLLEGVRGTPPADTDAVVGLVTGLGELALEAPEVAEVDLNPVLAHADGCDVIDAKLRLTAAVGSDDGLLRQLRPQPGRRQRPVGS